MDETASEKETKRLEAFSDGVFAIAITLLILEVRVPPLSEGGSSWDLGFAIIKLWPSLMAFAFSFLAILVMWMSHHAFFTLVGKVNKRFILANGFVLLMVTFVPFPTAILAKYIETPAAKAAVVFYSATYVLVNLAFGLLWMVAAYRRQLICPHVPSSTLIRLRNAYLLGIPIYVIALVVAFINAWAGLGLCMALWGLWANLNYGPSDNRAVSFITKMRSYASKLGQRRKS